MDLSKLTPGEWGQLIIAVTAFLGLILSLWNTRMGARKGVVEELRGLIDEYRKENQELKKDLSDKDVLIEKRDKTIEQLAAQIKERDELIDDLKDWIERLLKKFGEVAPAAVTPKFQAKHFIERHDTQS